MNSLNPFKNIYLNRDLIYQFTNREIQTRHKGTRLGAIWSLISPLMMLGLYLIVFGLIFGGRFGILPEENFLDFALALFLGLSLFNVIADSIAASPLIIVSQPNFVKKVVFPLEILSISKIISSFYFSMLSILIVVMIAPFTHSKIHFSIILVPIILIPLAMIALGISWALASLGVFYRDLNQVTPFINTALMYGSAIVYSPRKIPGFIQNVLHLNPILIIVDQTRSIMLWNQSPDYKLIIQLYITSIAILTLGYLIFIRLRPFLAEAV